MRRLIIATHNAGKAREMLTILKEHLHDMPVEIRTLADFPGMPKPEEHGDTYLQNAAIKARAAADSLHELAIADDAGLEVDALNGEPGLHSRRYAGVETSFADKMTLLLERLKDVPEQERTARFRCAVAVAEPAGPTHLFTDTCEGRIAFERSGTGGFGYDPIFFLPDLGCTMADLTPEQKNRISHRGKTLAAAAPVLRRLLQQVANGSRV
ncbi:MAG: RdgB/HAM1 family non-canonical purine NTP pyrophosphatase [Fimbriimonadia bacterium]|jgi:XTP/dITP diphosphohydrolase